MNELILQRNKWKSNSDGLKTAINGLYGKLGSVYSPFYAPHLMIATTLTGQLSLLMLIERCEQFGIRIVSANTDGVTVLCNRNLKAKFQEITNQWELDTGFQLEWENYKSLYYQSVNSYIAIKEDGKTKVKGPLYDPWSEGDLRGQMSKNPQMTILSQALVNLARDNIPLADTIRASTDPRAFITVQKVNGGATYQGHSIGSVVRYYWAEGGSPILYAQNNHRVPKTEGSRPLMELTSDLPDDIDYKRYIAEAQKLAIDYAIIKEPGRLF